MFPQIKWRQERNRISPGEVRGSSSVKMQLLTKEIFIKNKRAVGRTQDLADIEKLCE
jgi:hypothetical protein